MSELLSASKAPELGSPMVHKDVDDSWLEDLDNNLLFDNNLLLENTGDDGLIESNIALDGKLDIIEDNEHFYLLDESDSLQHNEVMHGQQEKLNRQLQNQNETRQPLQQGNETLIHDFKNDIWVEENINNKEQIEIDTELNLEPLEEEDIIYNKLEENDAQTIAMENDLYTGDEPFPENEDVIVLEEDELTADAFLYDEADAEVLPDDLKNESVCSVGKQAPRKENGSSNNGQFRCILEYNGIKNSIFVKPNKCLGELMQDLKSDLVKDEVNDYEIVLTFIDPTIDGFRLVLTQDNKYSQEFTLGKIINVHNKYRMLHKLSVADIRIIMTLQDRFISQYQRYDDATGERPQTPIITGDSSMPESFIDCDKQQNDIFIDKNIEIISPVEDDAIKTSQETETGNSLIPASKDVSLTRSEDVNDGHSNGVDELPPYSGDEDEKIDRENCENNNQETYDETDEPCADLPISYEENLDLYDKIRHHVEQFAENGPSTDKLHDPQDDTFNESLDNFDNLIGNFDESSYYYNQDSDNYIGVKDSDVEATVEITDVPNNSETSKSHHTHLGEFEEKASSPTEPKDVNEHDLSDTNIDESDLFNLNDDEWINEYSASEFDTTIDDQVTEVSNGKRERPYTSDIEDEANKKTRIE